MAPHPPQPLNFLNVRNQVQTGQVSFITSPGIFPNTQLGRENVPTVNPALGAAISNVKDAAIALGVSVFATRILMLHLQGFYASASYK
jgi:hypothetical protein